MKEQLDIRFHNPNQEEEIAKYFSELIVDILENQAQENSKDFFELIRTLLSGGEN